MDIDLCDQQISELVFDPATTTEDEQLVASTLLCLRAERNQIHRISGLGSSFANLTTLLLSNNNLGMTSTAPHDALRSLRECQGGASLCDGVPAWVAALPASLQTLDVSFNHLRSLLACTCATHTAFSATALHGPVTDEQSHTTSTERYLRHACPLALCLFFPRERFPFLENLKIANNAFACTARESGTMEDLWESQCTKDDHERHTAVRQLDVSGCPGLFAVNPFVLCSVPTVAGSSCVLGSIRATGTSVNDLTAVAAVGFYAPSVTAVSLSSTPVCSDLLHVKENVLSDFLEDMIHSISPPASNGVDRSQSALAATALDEAAHELAFRHLGKLAASIEHAGVVATSSGHSSLSPQALRHQDAPAGPLATLRSCVYALLLRTVIPTLQLVDDTLAVDACRHALVDAALGTLASISTPGAVAAAATEIDNPPATVDDGDDHSDADPTEATLSAASPESARGGAPSPNWSALAAYVDPAVRTRVVVPDTSNPEETGGSTSAKDAGASVSEDSTPPIISTESVGRYQQALAALQPTLRHSAPVDAAKADDAASSNDSLFVPSRLEGAEKAMFEELSREATSLEDKLVASRDARRTLVEQARSLREQLTADRLLVRDQRQEVLRLRAVRDELAARTASKRALLAKRRKEVSYGVQVIESKEAAARNRETIAEMQRQQRADRQRQRVLQRRASQNSNFSVHYAHAAPPTVQHRKTRSDLLREEAIQQRMALNAAAEGPFTYEPKPFRSRQLRTAPPPQPPRPQPASPKSPDQLEEEYLTLYDQPMAERAASSSSPEEQARHVRVEQASRAHTTASGVPVPLPPPAPPAEAARRSASFPLRAPSPSAGASPLSDATSHSLPLVEKDLSTLSLTELFEAAAAVRRKQMALQQLHQRWTSEPANPLPTQTAADDEEPVNRALFDSSVVQ